MILNFYLISFFSFFKLYPNEKVLIVEDISLLDALSWELIKTTVGSSSSLMVILTRDSSETSKVFISFLFLIFQILLFYSSHSLLSSFHLREKLSQLAPATPFYPVSWEERPLDLCL